MRHNLFSWLKIKVFLTILIVIFLKMGTMAQVIPYPNALNSAAIVQPSICNVDTNGMIIGNGDINALIYSVKDQLIMHLAKNDVWDARLITEKDMPLLSVDVANHSWKGGGQPPSWNNPYPTQTPPSIVRILATGDVKDSRIDLRLGMAMVKTQSGLSVFRAVEPKNVYYIETDGKVSLEGFPQSFLPEAEKSEANGMVILRQHLPEDPDYAGMDV